MKQDSDLASGVGERALRELAKGGGWLLGILLVAAALRLYGLGTNPPGLFCDEIALGVNAAALGSTGKSLAGEVLPLYVHEKTFEASSIVYQPVFQYALVPFVQVLGRSAFVVRLPSVLFGLAAVVGVYLLAGLLFGRSVGLVAAALLAISPWHCHFSRIAFEAISLPPLLIFGVYFFVRGLETPRLLYAGASLLSLATYAYPPARMFVPILTLGLAATYFDALRVSKKHALGALLVAALVGLPNFVLVLTSPSQSRMYSVLVTSRNVNGQPASAALKDAEKDSSAAAFILRHQGLLLPYVYGSNYLSHLSPRFLFLSGDANARHGVREMGMCYFFIIPFLIAGLISVFRSWKDKRSRLLLLWFVAWPVPASLTVDAPHAIRAMTNFPVLEVLTAIGMCAAGRRLLDVLEREGRRHWRSWAAGAVAGAAALLASGEIARYVHRFHEDYRRNTGPSWDSGLEEAFRILHQEARPDEQILVSSNVGGNPYLAVLFYSDVDFRTLDPTVEGHLGQLPSRFLIARAGERAAVTSDSVLLLRASEQALMCPRGVVIAAVTYPDGKPNLLLMRGARQE